ncbi:MAG: DUF1653 domain-containing protein [Candidatus Gracilibacteria bacterium]
MVQPGQIYRHYKGKEYKILTTAKLEATLEDVVVYEGQYEDTEFGKHPVWVRPLSSFMEIVQIEKDNGQIETIRRFTQVGSR